jgi:adenylate cyclase
MSIWRLYYLGGDSVVEERAKRKLTAILSADVKGYSHLMGEDELSTIETLKKYRELIDTLVQQYRGRVVDSPGDNMLTEFSSVVDAVDCAVEIQKELKLKNDELPQNRRMQFRIGVNLGDVVEDGERIYGDGVNIAARVESLAEGGGICVSGTAYDQIGKKLDLGYEYLGEQVVKNIEKPVRVYRVLMEPEYAGKVVGEERPKPKQWRWAAIAIGFIIVVGALAIWNFYFRPPPIEPASVEKMAYPLPEKPSIAVLPFDNLSGDAEQEYIADGFTENIITGLSQNLDLFVIAPNSVFTYKGKPVKIKQVSEELGVRYILEGSIQKSGDQLRVTAQLINATEGQHLWAERYDRKLKDLFVLQDEITLKIISALAVKLTEGEQAAIRRTTENFEAWGYCVKGVGLFEHFSKEDNARAQEYLEKAVMIDPEYAFAWTMLAWVHVINAWFGFSESPSESIKRAVELAKNAAVLGGAQSELHSLWSTINLNQRLYEKAIEAGQKAITNGPNNALSHVLFAYVMLFAGKFDEAVLFAERSIRLTPYCPDWYLSILGQSYRQAGRFKEAFAAFSKALDRSQKNKSNPMASLLGLIDVSIQLGRDEQARSYAAEVMKISPNFSFKYFQQVYPYKDPAHLERILINLRKAGLPETPPLPFPDKPSIAVLPFVNMSGDPEQEYFSDGISEEIITALSKTPKLFVIARTSSFKYKGKDVDVRTVGRELGVRYVLEGSVRKAGDKVRITAQLIDAKTNNHLWAERYDRAFEDIFAIQDEITMKIINAMEVKLTEGEQAVIQAKGTMNLDAYLKYLQAREYVRLINKEDNIRAQKIAEEIIALDPSYPSGYRILAFVEINSVWFGWSKSPKDSLMQAIKLAKKAIEIEDSSGPHRVLAYTYVLFRKHDEAIKEAKKALEMEPNSGDAHNDLGHVLFQSDMAQEAISVLKKAIRLNPYPPSMYFHNLAWAYHSVGKYDEAINSAKKAIQINPKDIVAHRALVSCYSLLDRDDDARAEVIKVLQIDPNFSVDRFAKISPFKNKDKAKKIWDSYRKAGLK